MNPVGNGTKTANADAAQDARFRALETAIRQIPSRYAQGGASSRSVLVVVRFDFSGGTFGGNDQSEGELINADETRSSKSVWIDGIGSIATVKPGGFGNGIYTAAKTGTRTISGDTRDLYRVTGLYLPISGTYAIGTAPAVVEVTNQNCCRVLDASETSIQTTIVGVASDNILALNGGYYSGTKPPTGSRLDWQFATWISGYQVLPDFQAGCGRGGGSAGTLRIDYGEPFDLILGRCDPSYQNSGPAWFGKLSYARIQLRMHSSGSPAAAVIGTYELDAYSLHFDSVIANYFLDRSTGPASVPTMTGGQLLVTVKDKDGVDQACVISFTFDAYNRITAVASSSGILVPIVFGGRR